MTDLALFDFDGTLTTSESFPAFIRSVVSPLRRAVGGVFLAPWVIGYRRGWVHGVTVRSAVVRVALRGMPVQRFNDAAERYALETLPGTLRPEAMAAMHEHQQRGDTVLIVTGTFEGLLLPWATPMGVGVLASRLEEVAGVLSGRYAGAQCVGAEKARRVLELIDVSQFNRIHAYGDTPEDADLLALADVRHYRGLELAPGDALPV